MAKTEFDFSELEDVLGELEKRGANLSDYGPVAADILVGAVLEVFEQEGPGWAATQRGGTILQDTGNLVNSISPHSEGEIAEAFTNVPYAGFHVTGTRNMPQRDFLAIDQEATLEEIATAILLDIESP